MIEAAIRFGFREAELRRLELRHIITAAGEPRATIELNGTRIETDPPWGRLVTACAAARREFAPKWCEPTDPVLLSSLMTRLSTRSITNVIIDIGKRAGVTDLSYHVLRATFIHSVWMTTLDPQVLKTRCRIKSAATLAKYIS